MDCDALKKTTLTDTDGSFLGSVGTVIPVSEYQWNGDPRRGLGDYRIPKVLLTAPDGTKLDVNTVAPKKGISHHTADCEYEGRKCFYLTMHSTHFIYDYLVSDIW